MKHPHCNRSHIAHAFWCRGFAPMFFIVSVALIVVAVGSGVYFTVKKNSAQSPVAQTVLIDSTDAVATSTAVVTTSTNATSVSEEPKKIEPALTAYVDCGSSEKATACLGTRLQTCTPAKGIVTDPSSGMQIERTIDGYKGGNCLYRSNIISAPGVYAITTGMYFDCALPKTLIATSAQQAGVISGEDMLTYCTGSLIDLMRAQMGATQ